MLRIQSKNIASSFKELTFLLLIIKNFEGLCTFKISLGNQINFAIKFGCNKCLVLVYMQQSKFLKNICIWISRPSTFYVHFAKIHFKTRRGFEFFGAGREKIIFNDALFIYFHSLEIWQTWFIGYNILGNISL